MKTTISEIVNYLRVVRQVGHTTYAIRSVINNRDAILIVVNYDRLRSVISEYPSLQGRVFTLTNFLRMTMRGRKNAVVFDPEVVFALLTGVQAENKKMKSDILSLKGKLDNIACELESMSDKL